jgi:hypothetical protein
MARARRGSAWPSGGRGDGDFGPSGQVPPPAGGASSRLGPRGLPRRHVPRARVMASSIPHVAGHGFRPGPSGWVFGGQPSNLGPAGRVVCTRSGRSLPGPEAPGGRREGRGRRGGRAPEVARHRGRACAGQGPGQAAARVSGEGGAGRSGAGRRCPGEFRRLPPGLARSLQCQQATGALARGKWTDSRPPARAGQPPQAIRSE